MNVKELLLGDLKVTYHYFVQDDKDGILLRFGSEGRLFLDRSQAYLLMLYLQEHLK